MPTYFTPDILNTMPAQMLHASEATVTIAWTWLLLLDFATQLCGFVVISLSR